MTERPKLARIAPRPSPSATVSIPATAMQQRIASVANQNAPIVIRMVTLPVVAATTAATVSVVQLPSTSSPVKVSEHNSWQGSPCLSPTGGSKYTFNELF